MQEIELYPPLKTYLENQGYEVKSEILNCDVVAIREGDATIVVELKLSLNLTILLQAVDRLKISNTIYIGVPTGLSVLKKHRKQIVKLMRMLGLGLIVIDARSRIGNVDVLCDPGEYKPRQIKKHTQKLLKEFQERVGDPNSGGSSMQHGIMTAYRQKALAIAGYLQEQGATKAATIAKSLEEPKTRNILYDNVYGWFERLGQGIYTLSPRGNKEVPIWNTRIS
ncbi:MAG: hypothetical protein HOD43_06380 [Candidatus Marinimicrobia bacterium]|nr:hypothetical protein [Candidatus Neomarinimicrobiota bacterium]MBT3630508.1 hypothetical protein [Candidatus Neomarinimicrobiota bacterium]MBT3823416.1 hypothetical protein [Candidatus Neomarinimicrobiota bacterium]MBT4131751.1 hypothetical protein [Candidatus Neomarinimicrobiota bacterium]MBT4295419.1 hypothetical protein [Candidatus Neomarinimicrobiota bacterium]